MICGDDYSMPDMRRIDGGDQAGFLSQLTAQRGQPVLTWFYAATWSSPDGLCWFGTAGWGKTNRHSRTWSSSSRMIARTEARRFSDMADS